MKIRIVTPTNGTPSYIELQVGEAGIIELHSPKHPEATDLAYLEPKCYGHDAARDEELPAYPDGYDQHTKIGSLEDLIELRDAMHNQFGF